MSCKNRRFRVRVAYAATAALAWLVSAVAGTAQTLAVETGQHAGFTRLVVRIGAERDWDLTQTDAATWRLTLSPEIDGFDLSDSFDLIQRSRVADLTQEGDALVIGLACDCSVTGFRFRDTFVVIDVGDSDPDARVEPDVAAEARPEVENPPLNASRLTTEEDPSETSDLRMDRVQPSIIPFVRPASGAEIAAAALPDLARLLTPGPTLVTERPKDPLPSPQSSDVLSPPVDAPRTNLQEAAQIMAEQLARAAAAGLLEPASGVSLDFADPKPLEQPLAAPPVPLTTAPAQPSTGAAVNAEPGRLPPLDPPILARNAFDIAAAPLPDEAPEQPRLACAGRVHPLAADHAESVADEWLNVHALGPLRQAVFDDRDQLVDAAVLRLALHYLKLGFGAEAEFWLTRLNNPPDDLVALAQMADGMETTLYADVTDSTTCSDQELVFRYLGGAMPAPIADTEAHRIQQGFAALPDQLQRQFGPEIARRLSAEGQAGPAHNLRDMLRRSGIVPASEMLALDFDLGIAVYEPDVDAAFTQALRDDGAAPAATMARLLALDRQQGRRSDIERLTAAEGLLRETPPGRDGDLLWREITIGHARVGQVDTALSSLVTGSARDPDIWQSAVTGLVADRLDVEDSASLLILAHLVGDDWTAAGSETGRVRMAASQFLVERGLEEAAAQIMAGRPALIVPDLDGANATSAPSGWAQSAWAEAAETYAGAHGDIARRMAAQDEVPNAAADSADGVIDLEALSDRIADTQALRDAAGAILTRAPLPAIDPGEVE